MRGNYILLMILSLIMFSSTIPVHGYGINLTYTNTDSQTVYFNVYEGSFLFVEAFWTYCSHCQKEYPVVKQIYDNYGTKMKMLSLAIWNSDIKGKYGDNVDTIKQWQIDYPTPWDLGVDLPSNFIKNYDIPGTPTMLLFGKEGDLLHQWPSKELAYQDFTDILDYYLSFTAVGSTSIPPYTQTGGSSDNGSVIGNLFASPIFRFLIFTVLLFAVYFKATGGKPPAT